jgi:putative MFS transporter
MQGKSKFYILDNAKYNTFMRITAVIVGLGAFTDLYNTATFSGSAFSIEPYYHITSKTFGEIGLVFFIGAFLGAIIWGPITDKIGRRLTFIIDLVLMAIFALLSGFSVSLPELITFRFLMGIGLGGDFPAALSLLAEFSPSKVRGSLMTIFWVLFGLGGMSASLVAYALFLHYGTSQLQWRILLASGAIPATIGALLRFEVPESPRWLVRKGRLEDAVNSILKLTGVKINIDEFKSLPLNVKYQNFKAFFSKRFAYITLPLFFAMFLPNSIPGSLGTFNPIILHAFGFSGAKSLLYTAFVFFGAQSLGAVFVLIIIDKVGRITTFLIGSLGMTALSLLTLITQAQPALLLFNIVLLSIVSFFWLTVAFNWGSELYPTAFRGIGSGFDVFVNRVSGGLFLVVTPILLASYHTSGLFVTYAILSLIGGLVGGIGLRKAGKTENKTLEEATEV